MAKRREHLDDLLKKWPYEFGEVTARQVAGSDGREVLQLRVDMGVLQMECTGRPDGSRPEGFETYYDYLVSTAFDEGDQFELDEDRCLEIDREFVQFFHRRICWLALREFANAARDADHTLSLMDFSSAHAPDESWAMMHEQYRPFVLFHRTQASALVELETEEPQKAIEVIDEGLRQLRNVFEQHEAEEHFDEDELVVKLIEMRDSIAQQHDIEASLTEQLADAIADEHYELAAELRDKIARRNRRSV